MFCRRWVSLFDVFDSVLKIPMLRDTTAHVSDSNVFPLPLCVPSAHFVVFVPLRDFKVCVGVSMPSDRLFAICVAAQICIAIYHRTLLALLQLAKCD